MVANFLVWAEVHRETNRMPPDAILTLVIPEWVAKQIGEDSITLMNISNINVQVNE